MNTTTQPDAASNDFMRRHATSDKDYFRLSSGEHGEMVGQLDHVLQLQGETFDALETLALNFLKPGHEGVTAPAEIVDLRNLARCGLLLLEEIVQAITHRRNNHQRCSLCVRSAA